MKTLVLEFVIFALYRQISGAIAVGYNCVDCEWREKVSAFSLFVFELCVTLVQNKCDTSSILQRKYR